MNELVKAGELTPACIKKLVDYETALNDLKARESAFRAELQKAMEDNGIKSYKNDQVTITLVAGGQKEHFDAKSFRKDHPKLYDAYIELSEYAGSLRIKL